MNPLNPTKRLAAMDAMEDAGFQDWLSRNGENPTVKAVLAKGGQYEAWMAYQEVQKRIAEEAAADTSGRGATGIDAVDNAVGSINTGLRAARDSFAPAFNAASSLLSGPPKVAEAAETADMRRGVLSDALNPVPGDLTSAAVTAASMVPGMGPAARTIIPMVTGAVASKVEGKNPLYGAAQGLGPGALEGAARGYNAVRTGVRNIETKATAHAANKIESASFGDAVNEVLAGKQTGPQRIGQVGRTAEELLEARDPGQLVARAKGVMEAEDRGVVQALVQRGLPRRSAEQFISDYKGQVDLRRAAKASQERGPGNLIENAAIIKGANQAESRFYASLRILGLEDSYKHAQKTYSKSLGVGEILEAGGSTPGSPTNAIWDAQKAREFVQQNRERFPRAEYGPVLDALEVGKGEQRGGISLRPYEGAGFGGRISAPINIKTVNRPGAAGKVSRQIPVEPIRSIGPVPLGLPVRPMNVLGGLGSQGIADLLGLNPDFSPE